MMFLKLMLEVTNKAEPFVPAGIWDFLIKCSFEKSFNKIYQQTSWARFRKMFTPKYTTALVEWAVLWYFPKARVRKDAEIVLLLAIIKPLPSEMQVILLLIKVLLDFHCNYRKCCLGELAWETTFSPTFSSMVPCEFLFLKHYRRNFKILRKGCPGKLVLYTWIWSILD